jgi:Polysaccharide deacetylase
MFQGRTPTRVVVIGYLAAAYPDLVWRELRLGMPVGNHSYNHPEVPPFDQLPARLLRDEIALGAQVLSRLGARPRLFRPPGGSSSPALVRAAAALGQRVVLWSVDPADWSPGSTAKEIARRVLSTVRPGSIVILHDGGGDRSATLAALPAIAASASEASTSSPSPQSRPRRCLSIRPVVLGLLIVLSDCYRLFHNQQLLRSNHGVSLNEDKGRLNWVRDD